MLSFNENYYCLMFMYFGNYFGGTVSSFLLIPPSLGLLPPLPLRNSTSLQCEIIVILKIHMKVN